MRATALVSFFQQRGWTKHTLDFCHLKIQEILFFFMMLQEIETTGNWNEPIADLCQTEIPQTLCFAFNIELWHLRLHRCSSQLLELCWQFSWLSIAHLTRECGLWESIAYFSMKFSKGPDPVVMCFTLHHTSPLRFLLVTKDSNSSKASESDARRAATASKARGPATCWQPVFECQASNTAVPGLQIWNRSPAPWRIRFWMCFLSVWMSTLSP